MPKGKAGDVDLTAGNAGEQPAGSGAASPVAVPEVTMQQLIDAHLNAFGLQLFAESVAQGVDGKTFKPFAFKFRGIKITLEPDGEVDTSHH